MAASGGGWWDSATSFVGDLFGSDGKGWDFLGNVASGLGGVGSSIVTNEAQKEIWDAKFEHDKESQEDQQAWLDERDKRSFAQSMLLNSLGFDAQSQQMMAKMLQEWELAKLNRVADANRTAIATQLSGSEQQISANNALMAALQKAALG
jgi:hypothetical protein